MPNLDGKRIAILVGSHKKWNNQLTQSVEKFCESYNSVVFCDHTSAYNGRYRIQYSLIGGQEQLTHSLNRIDALIHIGEIFFHNRKIQHVRSMASQPRRRAL